MWANNLKVFSAFAVVILHVSGGFVGNISISDPIYGNYEWWAGNIYDSLTRWCVPLFIMVSGYYLLNKEEPAKVFFQKRLNKVLTPIIFWSLFFSFWTVLKLAVEGKLSNAPITLLNSWASGKPYFHLWYLFMIPFLYTITPVLRLAITHLPRKQTFIFIFFCLILATLNTLVEKVFYNLDASESYSLFTNDFLYYIGYFCLGGYFAKYEPRKKNAFAFTALLLAWITTIIGSYLYTYKYFYSYLSVNTVVASVALFLLIKWNLNKKTSLNNISKFTLGIYLVHPVFLDILNFIAKEWLLSRLDVYVYIPLASVVIFCLSCGLTYVLSKVKLLNKCV